MGMQTLDWTILFAFIVFITLMAYSAKKYTTSVADFLSANRCAGRYLLAVGDGMAGLAAMAFVGMFQMCYESGFTGIWWQSSTIPAATFVTITGLVIYRFRQTRAMTLAQFFEQRYGRKFRIFAGFLCFVSGVINFGIFPAVAANFFMHLCGLPETLIIFDVQFSTFPSIMVVLLSIALAFTFIGGQIAVVITDFFQGVFCNIVFVAIFVFLFIIKFDWSQIASVLVETPPNQSMINPYKTSDLANYSPTYFLINIFSIFYLAGAWQGQQAYNSSAKNANEAKMSKVIAQFRWLIPLIPFIVIPVCVYTFMHHPSFAGAETSAIEAAVGSIGNEQIQKQMIVPIALRYILPTGLIGMFCAVLFAAFISTHDTYLHSWGCILLQDVIMPFRKSPFKPKEHIWYLRLAILAVAVFIFLFSLCYRQSEDIFMHTAWSGTIFLGGAGAAIIGGFYWKRGTSAGAWAAMIFGLAISLMALVCNQWWQPIAAHLQDSQPQLWQGAKDIFPTLNGEKSLFNSQHMFFFAMAGSCITYIVVSLLTSKHSFNLDRMLHRGQYAKTKGDSKDDYSIGKPTWKQAMGFDKKQPLHDKLIYAGSYSFILILLVVIVAGTIINLIFDVKDEYWLSFWHGYLWVLFVTSTLITLWLTIGGFGDLKKMFYQLKIIKRDDRDDGTVVDHHNLDEQ